MHIVKFTLVYPPGQQPDDVEPTPEGIETSGIFEIYEFQTAITVPFAGEVKEFPLDGQWVVAEVQSYYPQQDSNLEAVHVAICSRDGQPPKRDRFGDNDFRVLGLLMDGDEIVEREPGLAHWWVGSEFSMPKPSDSKEVLLFKPSDRPTEGYDVVAICRTQRAMVAA